MRFEQSAGAIIFRIEKGKILYLMLQYPTYWGFVRGIIEKNESVEETIKREAKEEAGLDDLVFVPGFKEKTGWFFTLKGELIRKKAIFLIAQTKSKEIKLSFEHKAYKWCSYDDALKLQRIKSNRLLLQKAHDFLQKYIKDGKLI